MTVCWVSDTDTTGVVSCQAGTDKPVEVKEKTKTKYHRVKVEKLKPATYYKYTVTCEGSSGEGEFRTAVPPGRTFRFVAYGDNRTQPKIHSAVLKGIAAFKPDFLLQTGDIVANGENQDQWDEYWQVAGPTLRSIPIYPTLGNHERNGAPYFRYFDVQRDYSFDYGDIHFVALDSNRPPSEIPTQLEWLRKDLAEHQNAAWRIVYMHHTLHTCTDIPQRRNESAERRKRMEPILQEGNVQLFISGHDHNYQRHVEGGITYLVSGGGGAPLYNLTPNTIYVVAAKKAHHHVEIIADAKRLDARTVEPDGTVIDQFDLKRE
jgi:predicted phosphodiesterase